MLVLLCSKLLVLKIILYLIKKFLTVYLYSFSGNIQEFKSYVTIIFKLELNILQLVTIGSLYQEYSLNTLSSYILKRVYCFLAKASHSKMIWYKVSSSSMQTLYMVELVFNWDIRVPASYTTFDSHEWVWSP